jgi:hypothetical protein
VVGFHLCFETDYSAVRVEVNARMVYLKSILIGAAAFIVVFIASGLLGLWSFLLLPRFLMKDVLHAGVDDTGGAYLFSGHVRVWPPGWLSFAIGIAGFVAGFYITRIELRSDAAAIHSKPDIRT